jgi:hypothetical protein
MTTKDTRALLDSLLARNSNSPEFTLEIEGYRDDLDRDDLDGADRKYIADVAKRLGVIAGGSSAKDTPEPPAAAVADSRFERAKAAFADMFNPDDLDPDDPETALRRDIYDQFSAELERIEEDF